MDERVKQQTFTRTYKAISLDRSEFVLTVHLTNTKTKDEWTQGSCRFDLLNEGYGVVDITSLEQPKLEASLFKDEINISNIRKGCVISGQGFAANIFADCYRLVPTAKTIRLYNVMSANLQDLILNSTPNEILDHHANRNVLIKSLLKAGFSNVVGFRDPSYSSFFSLRALVPYADAAFRFHKAEPEGPGF